MADQTTALQGVSKVPANSTLALTTSTQEWKFTDANGNTSNGYSFMVQFWSDQDWVYGSVSSNVVLTFAAGEKVNLQVVLGDSVFVKAATTSGTLYAMRVA